MAKYQQTLHDDACPPGGVRSTTAPTAAVRVFLPPTLYELVRSRNNNNNNNNNSASRDEL